MTPAMRKNAATLKRRHVLGPSVTGRKGEDAIDAWSFAHFASGVALGLLPFGWVTAVALVVGYEGFEGVLRHIKLQEGGLFEYESWRNIAMDIVLGMAGFAALHLTVARFVPWPWRLA